MANKPFPVLDVYANPSDDDTEADPPLQTLLADKAWYEFNAEPLPPGMIEAIRRAKVAEVRQMAVEVLQKFYSEDQPREHGRFAPAGGGGGGGGDPQVRHGAEKQPDGTWKIGAVSLKRAPTKAEIAGAKTMGEHAKNIDGLYQHDMAQIAGSIPGGVTHLPGPPKAWDRILRKAVNDYGAEKNPLDHVKDSVRCTLAAGNPEKQFAAIRDGIAAKFSIDGTKNGYEKVIGDAGYRDIKFTVKAIDGTKAEVIVATPEMLRAKNELGGHELYVQSQRADITKAEASVLTLKMRELYGRAEALATARQAREARAAGQTAQSLPPANRLASSGETLRPSAKAVPTGYQASVATTLPPTLPSGVSSILTSTSPTSKKWGSGSLSNTVTELPPPVGIVPQPGLTGHTGSGRIQELYSEDQARDPSGRFGSGTGAPGVATKEIEHQIESQGGITINRISREVPAKGFVVSVHPEHTLTVHVDELRTNQAKVDKWLKDKAYILDKPGNFVGAWHNQEDGHVYFDVVKVFPPEQKAEAISAGSRANQIAIWDIGNNAEIHTGGSGRAAARGWNLLTLTSREAEHGDQGQQAPQGVPGGSQGHLETDRRGHRGGRQDGGGQAGSRPADPVKLAAVRALARQLGLVRGSLPRDEREGHL